MVVRKLQKDDIFNSLVAGWNDLKAAPKYGLTIGALHTLGGWVAIFFAKLSGLNYFTYPFLTGIALIAPFSAAVLYEVSRRLETGEPLSWGAVLRSVKTSGGRDLGWMCLVSLFSFILWIDYSFFLYLMFYGAHMPDPAQFIQEALSTPKGHRLHPGRQSRRRHDRLRHFLDHGGVRARCCSTATWISSPP